MTTGGTGLRVEPAMTMHHGFLAIGEVADVALDEVEVFPLGGGDQGLHFVQVALVAGGKVV